MKDPAGLHRNTLYETVYTAQKRHTSAQYIHTKQETAHSAYVTGFEASMVEMMPANLTIELSEFKS